jgi:hypothetical protein
MLVPPKLIVRNGRNFAVSWELNGSGAVTLTHNLPLTRDFVRREGIEPPTR